MNSQFEFGPAENKHFSTLATYCIVSALALMVYAIANASFLFNVFASGKVALMVRTLDDGFSTLASFFAATSSARPPSATARLSTPKGMTFGF
jgi:hypothetical protein